MEPIVIDHLSKLEFGELQVYDNMGIIPLFAPGNGSPQYLTLTEALKRNLLTVTEVSEGGSVPELKVLNRADIPVLLLDGEELAGAKQNRVLNTTILLMANLETIIPVSCTEHGRWRYTTHAFAASGNIMNRDLRSRKTSTVSHSLRESHTYRSDQGPVWDGIAFSARMANVDSPTGAMRDIFESREDDLKGYLNAFPYLSGQKGVLVLVNGEVAGLDEISLESAYEALHLKLIKSYAMDALLQKGKKVANGSVEKARAFMEEARQCKEEKFKSVGHGWDHRFEAITIVGSALVYEEKVIHMAFFRMTNDERVGKMSSASRRRTFHT